MTNDIGETIPYAMRNDGVQKAAKASQEYYRYSVRGVKKIAYCYQ
jgi:hypothetical protein